MYAFFARWVLASVEVPKERSASVERPADLLVFYGRAHPGGASAESLLQYWGKLPVDPSALQLAVGARWPEQPPTPEVRLHQPEKGKIKGAVVISGREDLGLISELGKNGIVTLTVMPYRETRNTSSRFFTTYNFTADQIRVQRIVSAAAWAARAYGEVDLVGNEAGGAVALVARAVAPHFRKTVVNLEKFDASSDQAYLDRLFIPGIRRAGGLPKFDTPDVKVHNGEMGVREIVAWLLQR